jgi:ATP-dependent Lon protease
MVNNGKSSLVLVSEIYPDNIIVLPLENRPIFPGLALPLSFPGKRMVEMVEHALEHNNGFIGVSMIEESNDHNILQSTLYKTGTLLKVFRIINKEEEIIHFFAQAVTRFHFVKNVTRKGFPHWQVQFEYEDKESPPAELKPTPLPLSTL